MEAVSGQAKTGSGKRGRSLKGKETVSRPCPEAGKQRGQQRADLLKDTTEKIKKWLTEKKKPARI